jgi:hypothetical protein
VRDGRHGDEAELVASGNRSSACSGTHLEASNVGAIDVGHALVALVVLRLPN